MRPIRSTLLLAILAGTALRAAGGDEPADRPAADAASTPSASGTGIPAFLPALAINRWGAFAVQLKNPGDLPAELTTTTYFSGQPDLQYARKFWLPPRSRRTSWQLVKTHRLPRGAGTWESKTLVEHSTGDRATLVAAKTGEMAHSSVVRVQDTRLVTGILSDDRHLDVNGDEPAYEALLAMRFGAGLERRLALLDRSSLPPVAEALDSLDQLLVSSNALAADPAAVRSVRQWVQRGGKLWLMLDRVDVSTVNLLFGDAVDIEFVDRVDLTEVHIDELDETFSDIEPRSYEQPVELVRVLVSGVNVASTVDGWPAAFWTRIGRGEVLFTTLGPHGWMRRRIPSDRRPAKSADDTKYVPLAPLERLGDKLLQPASAVALDPHKFEPFLAEQIGYRIVSRRFVATVLGGFSALLAATSLALVRGGRPQHLAPIAAVLGIGAAAALVLAAGREKQDVPATVGVAQFVEASPGASSIELAGLAALYNREPSEFPWGSSEGGMLSPDMAELEGAARRLVWEDLDRWSWRNLTLPAGIRTAPLHSTRDLLRPIEARASLGSEGLTGSLFAGPFENLEDAIIATSLNRCLAARLDERGEFQAGPAEVLLPQQFVAGSLISDEQRRRQAILATLLTGPRFEKYSQAPTLLFWADPLDMGFDFPADSRRIGSALIAVPLTLDKTPPGARVVVPSPLLPYRSVVGPNTTQPSSLFGNSTGEWLAQVRLPSEIWLEFAIPEQVLPLRVERATLAIRIEAPGRTLEVYGRDSAGQAARLRTVDSAADVIRIAVDRPELLQLGDSGGLQFGIVVGPDAAVRLEDDPSGAKAQPWTIEYVELEIEGTTH